MNVIVSETQLRSRLKKWHIRKDNRRPRMIGKGRSRESGDVFHEPCRRSESASDRGQAAHRHATTEIILSTEDARKCKPQQKAIPLETMPRDMPTVHHGLPWSGPPDDPAHGRHALSSGHASLSSYAIQQLNQCEGLTADSPPCQADQYQRWTSDHQYYTTAPLPLPTAFSQPQTHPSLLFPDYKDSHYPSDLPQLSHLPHYLYPQAAEASLLPQQQVSSTKTGDYGWHDSSSGQSTQQISSPYSSQRISTALSQSRDIISGVLLQSPLTPLEDSTAPSQSEDPHSTPISVDAISPSTTEPSPDLSVVRRASALVTDEHQSRQNRELRQRISRARTSKAQRHVKADPTGQCDPAHSVAQSRVQRDYAFIAWAPSQSLEHMQSFGQGTSGASDSFASYSLNFG